MSVFLMSAIEVEQYLAKQAQAKRLSLNLTQETLALRSGVSYGVIKKFERSGQISLKSLLKLAQALGSLADFQNLFAPKKLEEAVTLDELINQKQRKRGRK